MEREGRSWCRQWCARHRKSASRWVEAVGHAVPLTVPVCVTAVACNPVAQGCFELRAAILTGWQSSCRLVADHMP